MANASDPGMSHADRHDLDKLARWKEGLDADDGTSSFPACAVFLVSPDDRASHDIFRRYRSAFEELGSGFHHLVIFGQHGVSTTQVAFLEQVGRERESVPLLALVPVPGETGDAWCIELPKGDRDGELDESLDWGAALERIRAAASHGIALSLEGVAGASAATVGRDSLSDAVSGVLAELGGKP